MIALPVKLLVVRHDIDYRVIFQQQEDVAEGV